MKVTLEIESLDGEIAELQRKRRLLVQKKDKLIEAANNKKTAKLAALNWNSEGIFSFYDPLFPLFKSSFFFIFPKKRALR